MPRQWPDIAELLSHLASRGYEESFRAHPDGLYATRADRVFSPDDLSVDEMHEVTGDDPAVAFSLRHPSTALRGVYAPPVGTVATARDRDITETLRSRTDEATDARRSFRVTDRRHWADDAADDDPGETERKPSFVEQLEERLRTTEDKLQETVSRHRAAVEEFDRARGRIEREAERRARSARMDFLRSFLDVLDDVDRAVASAAGSDGPSGLREGYELIQRRFLSKLSEHGVDRIDAAGERFDPRLHDAIAVRDAASPEEDGVVIDVLSPGYRLGDEVLRPASVAVAKVPATDATASTDP